MAILAERARFKQFQTRGPAIAKPVAPVTGGFLELVKIVCPTGQFALVDLVQAVVVTPSTTVLDLFLPGFTWQAYIADLDGKGRKPLQLDQVQSSVLWTFTDGRPVVRNLMVVEAKTLSWGIEVTDHTLIPAAIVSFAGAIVGTSWTSGGISEQELLGLWGRL